MIKELLKHLISLIILIVILTSCRTIGYIPNLALIPANIDINTKKNDSPRSFGPKSNGDINNPSLTHIGLFAGSFIKRRGILKKVGDPGPSVGIQLTNLYKRKKGPKFMSFNPRGFIILWTFDHFARTDSKILKPKYWYENYTNYLLMLGWHSRLYLTKFLFLNYSPGLAVNFIEIDTFRTNENPNDHEYTDIVFSIAHKLSLGINLSFDNQYGKSDSLNFSLFQYYSPDPLGKFLNNNEKDDFYGGGSFAAYLEYNFGF